MSSPDTPSFIQPANLTLAEIRRRWFAPGAAEVPVHVVRALAADPRAGAAALVARARATERQREAARAHDRRMLAHETPLWRAGARRIAGIDEAGMGPLAGPIVAAAVAWPAGTAISGLDDSKRLDAARRQLLFDRIKQAAAAWSIGLATPAEVDAINVYQAGLLAMRRAVEAMRPAPTHLLVDARRVPGFAGPQQSLVHGDQLSASIAAASIVAKVIRDRIMMNHDRRYPGYGFCRHKGYGTAAHRRALRRLGPSPIHRRSFHFSDLEDS